MLLTTPVARALRDAFPEAYIAWAVDRRCAAVVEGNPYLDETIVIPGNGRVRDLLRYWCELRRRPAFDWALDLHGLARSALVMLGSRAPFRVGFAGTGEGSRIAYHHRLRVPSVGHRVDYYAGFLEALGIPVVHREMLLPRLPEHDAEARRILAEEAAGTGPLVAMSLTAGRSPKCWPVEHFAELAERLRERHRVRVAVIGGPGDRPVLEQMTARLSRPPVDLVGRLNLKTLAALLQRVDLFVSADTGPMHIAASVKTPVVALFGPTNPLLYGPQRVEHMVLRKPCRCGDRWRRPICQANECMRAISVDEVEAAVLALLARVNVAR